MSSADHSIVLTNSKSLFCWGFNRSGQLGIGNTQKIISAPHKVDLGFQTVLTSSGGYHTIILKNDHTLCSWGSNQSGQLGNGYIFQNHPFKISSIGNVDLLGDVVDICSGNDHSMALLSDGSLYSWGSNVFGQLGIGDYQLQAIPVQISAIQKVIQIDAGLYYSMALTSEGFLYSWGGNMNGQLGNGRNGSNPLNTSPQRVVGISDVIDFCCGGEHVLALSKDGNLYGWGNNRSGILGLGSGMPQTINIPIKITAIPSNIAQISCGNNFSMALLSDGSLYSWGKNYQGQLGIGNTNAQSIPTKINGICGQIVEIRCGCYHSMVITSDNCLYSWGNNEFGQLGYENTLIETIPKPIRFAEKIYFSKKISMVLHDWPQLHDHLFVEIQKNIEEMIFIFQIQQIPKDLIIYFVKILLKCLSHK